MRIALSLYLLFVGILLSPAPGRPIFKSLSVADTHVAADSLPPKNVWWIDDILKKAPVKSYLFQSDANGGVSWLLYQPDTATCKIYQRTSGVDFAWSPKFRAGQELRLKESPFQTVKVASFDDYNSGKASYPILIFEEPYYSVLYLGYWSYIAESMLID